MQSGTRSCSNQTRSFCFFDAWWFSPLGGATVENGAGLLCPLCFSRLSTTARRIWFSSDTGSESPGSMWASSLRQKKGGAGDRQGFRPLGRRSPGPWRCGLPSPCREGPRAFLYESPPGNPGGSSVFHPYITAAAPSAHRWWRPLRLPSAGCRTFLCPALR